MWIFVGFFTPVQQQNAHIWFVNKTWQHLSQFSDILNGIENIIDSYISKE